MYKGGNLCVHGDETCYRTGTSESCILSTCGESMNKQLKKRTLT